MSKEIRILDETIAHDQISLDEVVRFEEILNGRVPRLLSSSPEDLFDVEEALHPKRGWKSTSFKVTSQGLGAMSRAMGAALPPLPLAWLRPVPYKPAEHPNGLFTRSMSCRDGDSRDGCPSCIKQGSRETFHTRTIDSLGQMR